VSIRETTASERILAERARYVANGISTPAIVEAARERGLILLSCGLYGNVIRLHVPLVIADDELERALAILEEAVAASS
jgi:4-aminobutyrate aminotransferase/(S)-3-amino-2-methylpropionate transaminase